MIFLMRHGADDLERFGGCSRHGLSDEEIQQVHTAKTLFADQGITAVYASDLERAGQTAKIISAYLSLPVTYLPQFREANNGVLAGMLKTEARIRYSGLCWNTLGWDEAYPDGESPHQFYDRVKNAWQTFRQQVQNDNVLPVTHGGVINVILCLENNEQYSNRIRRYIMDHAEVYWIAYGP